MNEDQYIDLITSSQPVKLDDLSEVDRKGIKDGKVYEGMTKDGVRIALGYPAAHQTPSLNENTWVYWTNRFKSFKIEFDENRKVTKIQ
jgi:outer membrane protein assembly factor BamE (lipoprotein component of BamABCDE complex)